MSEERRAHESRDTAGEDAVAHASELSARLARVAGEIADSEEKVAATFEDSARLRPHAAERLRRSAREARDFAAHEREQRRRLRPQGDAEGESGPDTPAD